MTNNRDEQKEHDKRAERNAKLKSMFLSTRENKKFMEKYTEMVSPVLEALNKKTQAGEKLTEEDFVFMQKHDKFLRDMLQSINDTDKLISNTLNEQFDVVFHLISKLAKEGNEEAKKIYDDMLTEYNKTQGADADEPPAEN